MHYPASDIVAYSSATIQDYVLNSALACCKLSAQSILFLTVTFITPPIYTAYLGQSAVEFLCSIPNATDISFLWHVNGTTLGSAELEAQGIELVIHRTIHKSGLIVSSTVANNNTRLECFGNYHDGSRLTVAQSTVATFHVQGQLAIIFTKYELLAFHLSYRCTGKVYWPPNHFIWKLPPTSHMVCSTNPQHNCSGARYIQLYCVQQHQY